ncbi:transmembrane protein 222 isoform X2 [Hippopotamus amphibius kiboko]|uniref:transmembrane protein 222 isoform X2 n=1 Tax=Hippopotamus amphibius kiboko TaxID=575201 RepID=UPI002593817A|nr:transmembrane protein 222 isoform X2 [Hippopotamus amphibius kiboko]
MIFGLHFSRLGTYFCCGSGDGASVFSLLRTASSAVAPGSVQESGAQGGVRVPHSRGGLERGSPAPADFLRYWKLDPAQVYASGPNAWDTAVHDASEEYKHRMHSLCCDNCHSHVALALNLMRYNNSTNWNMVALCFFCLLYGKYVSVGAFVKTWLPFVLLLGIILTVSLVFNLR